LPPPPRPPRGRLSLLGALQSAHELRGIYPILERFATINKHHRDLIAVLRIACSMLDNVDFVEYKGMRGL
jgi:hypothetical protein